MIGPYSVAQAGDSGTLVTDPAAGHAQGDGDAHWINRLFSHQRQRRADG